jgi:hypothetical protein
VPQQAAGSGVPQQAAGSRVPQQAVGSRAPRGAACRLQMPAHEGGELSGVGLLAERHAGGLARRRSGGPWAEEDGTARRKLLIGSGPPVCLKRLCLARVRVEADPWAGGAGGGASRLFLFLPVLIFVAAAAARVAAGVGARACVVAVEGDLGRGRVGVSELVLAEEQEGPCLEE